jgi:hypothetical protein
MGNFTITLLSPIYNAIVLLKEGKNIQNLNRPEDKDKDLQKISKDGRSS